MVQHEKLEPAPTFVAPAGTELIFDLNQALARLGGNDDLFADLVQFFHEDSSSLLGQIEAGIRDGRPQLIERGAHSLKGLISNFSAHRATEVAFALEQLAKSGQTDGAEALLRRLETEVGRLSEALAPYLR